MSNVSIRQVHKHYDDFHAVKGVSLEIKDKEFVVLVGAEEATAITVRVFRQKIVARLAAM